MVGYAGFSNVKMVRNLASIHIFPDDPDVLLRAMMNVYPHPVIAELLNDS